MKACHIVPPRVVGQVSDLLGDTHLILPSLIPIDAYRNEYLLRTDTNHIILDNGVAEGRMTSFPHLMHVARVMSADEVVLPDVMRDMDKTLSAIALAFYPAFENRGRFKYMLVLQGKTINECLQTAERAMNMYPGIINVFGIPRHILSVSPSARAQIAWELKEKYPDRPIHLLGTGVSDVTEVMYYANDFNGAGVRSVDTSLAWHAMRESVRLGNFEDYTDLTIRRSPIGEFASAVLEPGFEDAQLKLLRENMEVITAWAK